MIDFNYADVIISALHYEPEGGLATLGHRLGSRVCSWCFVGGEVTRVDGDDVRLKLDCGDLVSASRRPLNSTNFEREGLLVVDARAIEAVSYPLPAAPREQVMTTQPPSGEDSVIIHPASTYLKAMVLEIVQSVFASLVAGRGGQEDEMHICFSVVPASGPPPGDIPMPRASMSPHKFGGKVESEANVRFANYIRSLLGFFESSALVASVVPADVVAVAARPAVNVPEEFVFDSAGSSVAKPKALLVGSEVLVSKSPVGLRLPQAKRRPGEAPPELDRLLGIQGVRRAQPKPEQLAAQVRRAEFPAGPCPVASSLSQAPLPPSRACPAAVASVLSSDSPLVRHYLGLLQDGVKEARVPAPASAAESNRARLVAAMAAIARTRGGPAAAASHQFGIFDHIVEAEGFYRRIAAAVVSLRCLLVFMLGGVQRPDGFAPWAVSLACWWTWGR